MMMESTSLSDRWNTTKDTTKWKRLIPTAILAVMLLVFCNLEDTRRWDAAVNTADGVYDNDRRSLMRYNNLNAAEQQPQEQEAPQQPLPSQQSQQEPEEPQEPQSVLQLAQTLHDRIAKGKAEIEAITTEIEEKKAKLDVTLQELSYDKHPEDPFYCQWDPSTPTNSTGCKEKWISQLCGLNNHNNNNNQIGTRVLLFGDSTFSQQRALSKFVKKRFGFFPFTKKHQNACHERNNIQCEWKESSRCYDGYFYGFSPEEIPAWQHVAAQAQLELGEGPAGFGLGGKQHGCSDCAGCKTGFVSCKVNNTVSESESSCQPVVDHDGKQQQKPSQDYLYQGGYIRVEFARDVTIQTTHYNTSQENIALFLHREYNTPELVAAFGKPYCFVNTGHHDADIKNITKDIYVENVEWYLRLLYPECQQIFWIALNAPVTDDYPQKRHQTWEWNEGVRQMLERTTFGNKPQAEQNRIPFLDVYNASITHPHRDNIHMDETWDKALADFIFDLVEGCDDANAATALK